MGLCLYTKWYVNPYTSRTGDIMNYYKLMIGSIVYIYDNMRDARKAFHIAVSKNGINNVSITKVTN